MEPTEKDTLDLLLSALDDDPVSEEDADGSVPLDLDGVSLEYESAPAENEMQETSVFPTVVAEDDEDSGIFINWPGKLPEAETNEEDDEDDEEEDIGLFVKKKKKKKKSEKKTKAEKDDSSYAFTQAAESDEAEASGGFRRKQDAKDNENALNSVKYYKYAEKVRGLFLRRILPIVLALTFACGFFFYYFRLQHLTFDNLTGYDAAEVFRASGVRKNMFVFSISADEIETRLQQKFPYIQEIRVERELPDTVHIVFSEDCARFYTKMYDEYFIISDSLRVLGRCNSEDELPKGLRQITLPSISYAVVGHELRFFDESYLAFLTDFMETLTASPVYDKINQMDLSNRYYITFLYDNRLTFDIGTPDNLDTKLLYIKSLVEAIEPDDHGVFTLIGNKMASFAEEKVLISEEP